MLKLKLQNRGHLMQRVDSLEKTLMLGKIEGRRSSHDNGGISWVFSSCGASVGFLTRYDGDLREPLVRCQGS